MGNFASKANQPKRSRFVRVPRIAQTRPAFFGNWYPSPEPAGQTRTSGLVRLGKDPVVAGDRSDCEATMTIALLGNQLAG